MPKPNQTMLDQLVKIFKSTGNTAPFREMKLHGESTDPMIKARANQQRQENAQMGRLNAAIMNLYRRGYSMPEIREILRSRRMR